MQDQIKSIIAASIQTKQSILTDDQLLSSIHQACDVIVKALKDQKKLLFCGNGGSAADAQHLAAEFTGRFYLERKALPAEALHANTSYLTAVANDYGYNHVYSRLVDGIGHAGDILIALSTSGNSENIIRAIETSKEKDMLTIGFTGESGGKMKDLCDILINIPSNETPRIQESHIMVGHIICQLTESQLMD